MRKDMLLITVIAFGLTLAGIASAEDQPISEQIVDVMNKVFGVHPGFRANHAKGIVAEGHFTGAPEALLAAWPRPIALPTKSTMA
jgi:catalase